MSSLQSQVASGSNSIAQYAAEERCAPRKGAKRLSACTGAYDERRRHIVQRLNAIDGLTCVMPAGAFYVMVGHERADRQASGRPADRRLDGFCRHAAGKRERRADPGAAFCAEGYCRISYATSMEQIDKGVDRIEHFVNNLV